MNVRTAPASIIPGRSFSWKTSGRSIEPAASTTSFARTRQSLCRGGSSGRSVAGR